MRSFGGMAINGGTRCALRNRESAAVSHFSHEECSRDEGNLSINLQLLSGSEALQIIIFFFGATVRSPAIDACTLPIYKFSSPDFNIPDFLTLYIQTKKKLRGR
jgi:hypothetical protein